MESSGNNHNVAHSPNSSGHGRQIIVACIAVILLIGAGVGLAWYVDRPADTSHITYSFSKSSKFTDAQLQTAGQTTAKVFSEFKGCTIEKISYDEQMADRMLDLEDKFKAESAAYSSAIYEAYKQYGRDRIFMATVDFTCDGTNASLSTGEQSMTDYLYLNNDGKTWTEIDHGNG